MLAINVKEGVITALASLHAALSKSFFIMSVNNDCTLNYRDCDSRLRALNDNNKSSSQLGKEPYILGHHLTVSDSNQSLSPVNILSLPSVDNTMIDPVEKGNFPLYQSPIPFPREIADYEQRSEIDDAGRVDCLRAELEAAIAAEAPLTTRPNLNLSQSLTSSSTIFKSIDEEFQAQNSHVKSNEESVIASTFLRRTDPEFQMIPVFRHLLQLYSISPTNSFDQCFDALAAAMEATVSRKKQWTLKEKIMHLYKEENFDLNDVITTSNFGNIRECLPVLRFALQELNIPTDINSSIDEQVSIAAEILGIQDECKKLSSTRPRIERLWRELNFPLQNLAPGNNRVHLREGRVHSLSSAVNAIKLELELSDNIRTVPEILSAALNTITVEQDVFEGPNDKAKAIAQELGILTLFE